MWHTVYVVKRKLAHLLSPQSTTRSFRPGIIPARQISLSPLFSSTCNVPTFGRADVLAYISNLLLRTLPAIAAEHEAGITYRPFSSEPDQTKEAVMNSSSIRDGEFDGGRGLLVCVLGQTGGPRAL